MICPAGAVIDTDLIEARDAYRRNDLTALNTIAQRVPSEEVLAMYPHFWAAMKALNVDNEVPTRNFLAKYDNNVLNERLRNTWLQYLGKRGDWVSFAREQTKLSADGMDEETKCYADAVLIQQGSRIVIPEVWLGRQKLPNGCNYLIGVAAKQGVISQDWALQHIRFLLAGNYKSVATQLAVNAGISLNLNDTSGGEGALYAVMQIARKDVNTAASRLSALNAALTPEQSAFGWGQLGMRVAKNHNMGQALTWFSRAGNKLSAEQWEWWARAALRSGQWSVLESVIAAMPIELRESRVWQYWRARALAARGQPNEADILYRKVSETGRNFYALLAIEELGGSVHDSRNLKSRPSMELTRRLSAEPAIQRSLALFQIAISMQKPELRDDARREWRWAMRNRSDMELIAAAELAARYDFIEMSIYSADLTNNDHDFVLRYPTPHRDLMHKYSQMNSLDEAWAYGLIRQESRFIPVARSGVGASGLMQIMPATAKWIAGKLGEPGYSINSLDTNIRYGTWYLQYINNQLGDEVLATAGYNAGPGRARAWKDYRPLEGAIYAETIPFNETRDYVQKVMANATYYAYTFGEKNISLKRRMGTVPAK